MFKLENKIPDPRTDQIGKQLQKLEAIHSWTTAKKTLLAELIKILDQEKYIELTAVFKGFHIQRIGEACLYDVPDNKKGSLKAFRGKRIRVVCVGSGHQANRQMRVGIYKEPSA